MRPRHPRALVLSFALLASACVSPSPSGLQSPPPGANKDQPGVGSVSSPMTKPPINGSPSQPPSGTGSSSTLIGDITARPRTLAPLSGIVVAPATLVAAGGGNLIGLDGSAMIAAGAGSLIGMDGSTLVAAGGGNLVGNDGASLVAAGGGNYVLSQAANRPITRARVALAIGGKLLPIAPVETDENGAYRFPSVPTGVTCQVVVAIKTPGGGIGRLMSLAKASAGGTVVNVSPATTMVTAAVVGKMEAIGEIDPVVFQAATKQAEALLADVKEGEAPDLSDQNGLITLAQGFLSRNIELQANLDTLVAAIALDPQTALQAGGIAREQGSAGCSIAEPVISDEVAQAAALNEPSALATGPDGAVFVGDRPGNRVLKLLDGKTSVAMEGVEPLALLVDEGFLFVADGSSGGIVKAPLATTNDASARVTVVADDTFNEAVAMVRGEGNVIYVADAAMHQIFTLPANELRARPTLLAGARPGFMDGAGANARFYRPAGLAYDAAGKQLLVADAGNRRIRAITHVGTLGTTRTLAGGAAGSADGVGIAARFGQPVAIVNDPDGGFWVADATNGTLRQLGADARVTTIFGGCTVKSGGLAIAGGLAFGGNSLYYLDGDRVMRRQVRFPTTPEPTPAGGTPAPSATSSGEATATPTPTPTATAATP